MKKFFVMIANLLLLSGLANAGKAILELKGSYFSPTEQAFKDIYGGGLMYGGEASVGIWKNLEVWVEGNYFTKKGKLTFTQEDTQVSILPLGGGIKFKSSTGTVNFYVGAGLHYYHYKESNPIGDVSKNGLGYKGTIGSIINVTGGLIIDLYLDYSYCKMKPADYTINIGGIKAGIGVGYEFK